MRCSITSIQAFANYGTLLLDFDKKASVLSESSLKLKNAIYPRANVRKLDMLIATIKNISW